jgi:LysM repeat protein
VKYPFAIYPSKFVPAVYYLDLLKGYAQDKKPFQFKITRTFPNGKVIFDTDMSVTLEPYQIKEDAGNGFDVVVSIKLKQFRDYGTKTCKVDTNSAKPTASISKERAVTDNAPAKSGKEMVITVKKGDTLWGLCKTYLGDGSLYNVVAKENGIANPNLLQIGQKITLTVNATSGKNTTPVKDKTSGGSKNKPPFAILTSSYGVVRANVKTWNEAYGFYQANGGSGKGWKIVDNDKDVITL